MRTWTCELPPASLCPPACRKPCGRPAGALRTRCSRPLRQRPLRQRLPQRALCKEQSGAASAPRGHADHSARRRGVRGIRPGLLAGTRHRPTGASRCRCRRAWRMSPREGVSHKVTQFSLSDYKLHDHETHDSRESRRRRRAEQEIPSTRPDPRSAVQPASSHKLNGKENRAALRTQYNAIPLLRRSDRPSSDRPSFATEADALGQGSGLVQFAMGWPGAPAAPLTAFP